jgi:hypothetical protein
MSVSGARGLARQPVSHSGSHREYGLCLSFYLIILQLFYNMAFCARTFEGGLIPCRRETNSSSYHVDGELVLQTLEVLEKSFDDYRPIFGVCVNVSTIMLSPLPGYITVECCLDPERAPNRNQGNFRSTFISGLKRTNISISSMTRCKVYNPLWLLAGPKKLLEADILHIIEAGQGAKSAHPTPPPARRLHAPSLQ